MLIFNPELVPFILAGHLTTQTIPRPRKRPPRCGTIHQLHIRHPTVRDDTGKIITKAHTRSTIHRLCITAVAHQADGWHITFAVHKQPVEHTPRLLHRDSSHGYTNNPSLAMPGEPEAIDPYDLDRYAKDNQERHREFVRDQAVSLSERLAALEPTVPRSELRVIERRIAAIERQTAA